MADLFLCLKTNRVMTESQIRKSRRNMILRAKTDEWADFEETHGKFRRIKSTPVPADAGEIPYNNTGYEERDGLLYQVWAQR